MLAGSLFAAGAAQAELTGRFFYTPQERAMLEAQRSHKSAGLSLSTDMGSVTINGLVTRNTGKTTVWINGIPQNESEAGSGIVVDRSHPNGGKLGIRLPDTANPIGMRVGQTLEMGSGQIREVYEGTPGTP